jgi:hypothetical protein
MYGPDARFDGSRPAAVQSVRAPDGASLRRRARGRDHRGRQRHDVRVRACKRRLTRVCARTTGQARITRPRA